MEIIAFLGIVLIIGLIALVASQYFKNYITGRLDDDEFTAIVNVDKPQKGTLQAILNDSETSYENEHEFQEGENKVSFIVFIQQKVFSKSL
jgi:hypothetical protein